LVKSKVERVIKKNYTKLIFPQPLLNKIDGGFFIIEIYIVFHRRTLEEVSKKILIWLIITLIFILQILPDSPLERLKIL
jgi:hypothetical protein